MLAVLHFRKLIPHAYSFAFPSQASCQKLCLLPLQCCAVLCCAVLCCAVLCCAVLCCAVLCCAVLCCAVLCCAERLSAQAVCPSVPTLLQRQSRSWHSFPWQLWLQVLASAFGCQSMLLATILSQTSAQAWNCPHRYIAATVTICVSIHVRSMCM